MERKTTIKDIAREAGVSIATVSRVLQNNGYPVSSEIRRKVFDTAEKLDYKPNIFGRMLRGEKSIEIGIIVPSIINPFYAALVASAEAECLLRNYIPIICNSNSNAQLENWFLDMLEERGAAGVLLSTIQGDESVLRKLNRLSMPIFLLDQGLENYKGDGVYFNFFDAGYMATEHLIENGHKDIALISGPFTRFNRKEILRGYKKALEAYDLSVGKKRIIQYDSMFDVYNNGDSDCAAEVVDKLLREEYLPDGIVAINDSLAISLINEFKRRNILIPNDISIVGMDDIFTSKLVTPQLTTIHEPAEKMGKDGAMYLIEKIKGMSDEIINCVLQPTLVERQSVRKVNPKIRR
jgi:LacI family transcriptional regulator